MKLSSIKIENFKAFKEVEMPLNPNFNMIIGENNIGKSTLFEGIHLWMLGYKSLIQANGKTFYGKNTPRYIPFEKLDFLRMTSIDDVFHTSHKTACITLNILLEEKNYILKIKFEKPSSMDFYLRVKFEGSDFQSLSEKLREQGLNLQNSIFIYHTRPVFNAIKNEPFYNSAQLMKKITLGKSYEVIRNKILKSGSTDRRFLRLQERISRVFGNQVIIRFKNKNFIDEEYVRISIQIEKLKEIDIALVGSGILQVIDIFSTLEFINKKERSLNILLIDEPDSHIHSNLQASLIDELRLDVNYQHFLITHNDRLINKAQEGELLYINRASLERGMVNPLATNNYNSVTAELASKMFSLSEIERDKIIVITEGKTDKKLLEVAWSKLYPGTESPFKFICSGLHYKEEERTGGAEAVQRTLEFLSNIYDNIKIVGLFDNDKEGNEKFKGLKPLIFEPHYDEILHRKHIVKSIYGALIPIPANRRIFVTPNKISQRYLVIEHLFSDDVLNRFGMIGDFILGSEVFEINGSKVNFSNDVEKLPSEEFTNFIILFKNILDLFNEEYDR